MLGIGHLRRQKHWLIYVSATAFLIAWYYLSTGRETQATLNRGPDGVSSSRDKTYIPSPTSNTDAASIGSANTAPLSGTAHTQTVVIAKLEQEDASWVDSVVDKLAHLTSAIYTVDKATAPLTVPMNKGHEAMVYLTYIIDHYSELSEVTIFMHSHQGTWHNNDILDFDSPTMTKRLKSEHVIQNGYMNLRCHQEPGCPDHIHPTTANNTDDVAHTPEAAVIGASWTQLFRNETVPAVLSQPCCSQFAVSSERIRTVPLNEYVSHRDWLLATALEDDVSGRVWEYLWQWLFTGQPEFCPDEMLCYCEGYGVCFEPDDYREYFRLRDAGRDLDAEANRLSESANGTAGITEDDIWAMRAEVNWIIQKMEGIKAKVVGQ